MNIIASKEKLAPILQEVFKTKGSKTKTIECQVTIKNYDFKKDVRFDSNCRLPYSKREKEKITVIADKNLAEVCEANGFNYVMMEDVQGTTKEKKRLKKKICKRSHSFISLPTFNKAFEMRILASKNKPIFIIKNVNELVNMHKEVEKTVKFKLRKSVNMHFSVGYTGMKEDEVSENITTGLNHLVGLLKKGMQNIDTIFIKNTQGKPVRLFGAK